MSPLLTLNGREVAFAEGATLLEVVREAGQPVPTLCSDPRLAPSQTCRLCEVEVAGEPRPVCACGTRAEAGMRVTSHSPELEAYRRGVLEMLAQGYPREAVDAQPHLPFHRLLKAYGVEARGTASPSQKDLSHPYLRVDLERCVHCLRCVRICEEVQGQAVWKAEGRGMGTHVTPDAGDTLARSRCVSCGACADTCPSGAIQDWRTFQLGEPDHWVRTICPYCGVGCELEVGVREDHILAARPSMRSPVNRGHLCVKGRYGLDYVDAADRILHPMVRREGAWVRVGWDEALEAAADLLRRILQIHGPGALGVLASSRATNEDSYVAQKFARTVLGTHSVDCCARVCHAPSAAGLGLVFGTGAATNAFQDLEAAGAFLIVGCNPTANHPVVGARVRQRLLAGVPAVVIDPRRTELAAMATCHIQLRPGTNVPVLAALARIILEEGLADTAFLEARVEGLAAFRASIDPWTPEAAGAVADVPADTLRQAARLYAGGRPALILHGLGVTEHVQGTEGVTALAALALLTGNVGVAGGGVNPLRGQNNVQGTANMGCEPTRLTGYQKLPLARERHERVWGRPLPEAPGLTAMEMVDAAADGRLKALVVAGYDLLFSTPDPEATSRALRHLEGLVVVDLFLNETARAAATIFLPAASSFERSGTFMNAERRIQRIRPALSPRGSAREDWRILCDLAERLGHGEAFAFQGPEAIWNEVRSVWPAVAGITYARLEDGGLIWPCPTEGHPGTPVLHGDTFPGGPKAWLQPLAYRPSLEVPDARHPFLLNTGRWLYHFNAGTMTARSRNAEVMPDDFVQVHPADAARLGLADRDPVRLSSRHGQADLRAWITDAVRPGELFCGFQSTEAMVNRLLGHGRDAQTHTPEYKVTAVALTRR